MTPDTARGKGFNPVDSSVYWVLLLQSLLASGTHLVAKVAVVSLDPFTLTLLRSAIAAIAIGIFVSVRGGFPAVPARDLGLVLFLSFLAVPVNQFLFLYGIRYTTPSNAALLYATTPILVLLLSHLLLRERLTPRKILGVALGCIGVVIVVFERGVDAGMQYVKGNVIIYAAVVAWALYTVVGKRLIREYGPIVATSLTLITGTLLFIPLGIGHALEFDFRSLGTAAWMQVLYLALITSVVAYALWYYALARIDAGKVALFANLQPILTTVLAVLLLGQDITGQFVVGAVVAIAGVVVAQFG